jgi:hypothetical protein
MTRFFALLCCAVLIGLFPAIDAAANPRIGLLWWPADPANPANPFIESLQECLTKQLAAACPESTFVPPDTIRDALFPLLEPATQPDSEEAFAALLTRSDVRPRLVKRMDYLAAFTGGTAEENKGGILCGAGYGGGGCFGFAWINKDTRINVVIWDLAEPTPASHQDSRVEGTTLIPALLLPIPIPALTEGEACHDMSRKIVEFIRSRPQGQPCR